MKSTIFSVMVAAIAFCSVQHGAAQTGLRGKVQTPDGQPVPFALIQIVDAHRTVTADTEGNFELNVARSGTFVIAASSVGFTSNKDTISEIRGPIVIILRPSASELDEVVVNATRVTGSSGMAFSNLDEETIKKQNLGQDVPFVLSQVPGVIINSDAGNGVGYTGLRIRGSDATRVNITINGVPVNDAESQGTFWVNMPDLLSSVNSIQVQRGVGASSNGAGAFGASINLETNRLRDKPYAEVITTGGSFNTLRSTVAAGTGLLNNRFSLDARASRITSDGYIDRAYSNLHSYYLSAGWYGKKSVLKLINFYGKEKTYQAWNLVAEDSVKAGNRTYNEIGAFTDANGNLRYYDNQTDNYSQNNWQMHYVSQVNSRLNFNITGHYTKGAGYYEEYREDQSFSAYGIQAPVLLQADSTVLSETDLIRQRWLDNDFIGGVFNASYRFSRNFSSILGGGYNTYFGKHFGEVVWARNAGDSEIGHQYYHNTANKNDGNIYLKSIWQPSDAFSFFVDLQLRRVMYSYLGPDNNDTLNQQSQVFNFFNPKAGVSYDVNSHLNLYASAAVGNKEPNRNDFVENKPSQQPKHEQLLDLESGARLGFRKMKVVANYFAMLYRNQLVLNGEINDVGATKRINVPRSYRTGVELEIVADPVRWLTVSGNLVASSNKIVGFTEYADSYDADFNYIGNVQYAAYPQSDISFSPWLVTSGQVLVRPAKGLEVALIHKFVARQYLDNTSAVERSIDPYSVVDLRLNYEMPFRYPEISLMLGVYNLLSEKYETNGYTFGWIESGKRVWYNYLAPAAPVNFLGGMSIRF